MSALSLSGAGKMADVCPLDSNVVEMSLLLPIWQAEALEQAADHQGMSAGQMLREVIRDFFDRLNAGSEFPTEDRWD